jgi:hypothetical protein
MGCILVMAKGGGDGGGVVINQAERLLVLLLRRRRRGDQEQSGTIWVPEKPLVRLAKGRVARRSANSRWFLMADSRVEWRRTNFSYPWLLPKRERMELRPDERGKYGTCVQVREGGCEEDGLDPDQSGGKRFGLYWRFVDRG